jgi:hypothetical protein
MNLLCIHLTELGQSSTNQYRHGVAVGNTISDTDKKQARQLGEKLAKPLA